MKGDVYDEYVKNELNNLCKYFTSIWCNSSNLKQALAFGSIAGTHKKKIVPKHDYKQNSEWKHKKAIWKYFTKKQKNMETSQNTET